MEENLLYFNNLNVTDKNDYNERWDYDDATLTWTMAAIDTHVDLLDDGGKVKLENVRDWSGSLHSPYSPIFPEEPYFHRKSLCAKRFR